jgi:hypothetical protein
MPVRFLAALAILIALAALPSPWVFVAAAILLIVWLRRSQRVAARASTGTFLALALYAGLIAIVLVTLRAALGWLERPAVALEQTGIAPFLARGSLGFYDKSELRLALAQLLVLWVLFAALLAEMWNRQLNAPSLHPLTAVFALVLYFGSVQLPPYSSSLGSSLALMIGQLVAGAAMFVLTRWLTASRAMALLGASCVLLVYPGTADPWPWIGVLLYLAFAARRLARRRRLTRRQLVIGATLVIAIACTLLSAGRAVYWALAPSVMFVASILIRQLSIRFHRASTTPVRGFVPLAFCLLFNALFPLERLNERVASYMTRYEPAREAWYRECARGGSCDPAAKPSLAASLRGAMH